MNDIIEPTQKCGEGVLMRKNYIPLQDVVSATNISRRTLVEWCRKKYIREAYFETEINDYAVPKNYKIPYTKHGNPIGDGIYTSIVKGIIAGYDVCAGLYGLSSSEFEAYIDELISAGVVATFCDKDTGIVYYRQTMKSSEFSKLKKNKVRDFFKSIKPNIAINMGVNLL